MRFSLVVKIIAYKLNTDNSVGFYLMAHMRWKDNLLRRSAGLSLIAKFCGNFRDKILPDIEMKFPLERKMEDDAELESACMVARA